MSRLSKSTLTLPGMSAHIDTTSSELQFLAGRPASHGLLFPLRTVR